MSTNGEPEPSRLDRIEAAIDRLVQRHEALAQTVEIIAGMQRENEHTVRELAAAGRQNGENIRALVRIAEIHERRPTELEGGGETE